MTILRRPDFSLLLASIPDAPAQLWMQGTIDRDGVCVALVGTRRASRYGLEVAHGLAEALAQRGAWVVSGMALGIDAAAHRGALEAGGRTIAVLGCGLDRVYPPEHRALAEEISAQGALISEYPPGTPPGKYTFVKRNRIIAGLCAVTVVVESDLDGGAMLTADFACEQGRTVGAVPGRIDQPTSAGCHQLLKEGAAIVTGVEDIFAELGFPLPAAGAGPLGRRPAAPRGANTEIERVILVELKAGGPLSLDQVADRTGLPVSRAAATLLQLELNGALRKAADGNYEV